MQELITKESLLLAVDILVVTLQLFVIITMFQGFFKKVFKRSPQLMTFILQTVTPFTKHLSKKMKSANSGFDISSILLIFIIEIIGLLLKIPIESYFA